MATSASERKSFFSRIKGKKEIPEQAEMSFFDHIEELRWHLVRSVVAWLVAAILIFVYIDWVYDNIILAPTSEKFFMYDALRRFGHFIGVGDAFYMPPVKISFQVNIVNGTFTSAINIAMIGGVIAAFPYIFWELWRFIMPALSEKEKRYARGSIFWVSLCFFSGVAFGYYLLAPFTFNFLASFSLGTTNSIQYIPSINDYIESLTNLLLGCGIAFELPVLSYILAKLGIITGDLLKKYFKFAFVVILVVAAVITPSPDWTSQFLVAIPLVLLYWISIMLASAVDKRRKKEEIEEWS